MNKRVLRIAVRVYSRHPKGIFLADGARKLKKTFGKKKGAYGFNRVWLNDPVLGKETVGEFLKRHGIPIKNGKVTLYHARPKGSIYLILRPGTFLSSDPEVARFFAKRDRGLQSEDIEVLELSLLPDYIQPGVHISLRRHYPISKTVVRTYKEFFRPDPPKRLKRK